MNAFFSRILGKSPTGHFIAIDIGSNTAIRSLRFECGDNGCFAARKRHFELPGRESEADLIPLTSQYLRHLIFQYLRTIGRVPDEILIGLGGHFAFNEKVALRRARPDPRSPIRPREFGVMLDEFQAGHGEKNIEGKHFILAHLTPFRTAVDGYDVGDLSDSVRGRSIEISLLATYALDEYWEILIGLRSLLGGLKISFIAGQAAVAAALISILNVRDALLVKIGAKITEVSHLAGGAILAAGKFESGGDDITGAIAERLKIKKGDAERIKRQLGRTVLPSAASRIATEAVSAAADEWLDKLVKYLERDEHILLPERVYVFGGGARLEAISEALTSRPWFRGKSMAERPEVRRLEAGEISGAVFRNSSPPLSGPEEVALAALASRLGGGSERP